VQLTPALSYQASVVAAVFATDLAADVALRGTSDTDVTNSVTTSATSLADLGDHITRLKRRERQHGLGRCGKRQGKSNGSQPEHFFLPCRSFKKSHNLEQ
jgi:hypothetical protein